MRVARLRAKDGKGPENSFASGHGTRRALEAFDGVHIWVANSGDDHRHQSSWPRTAANLGDFPGGRCIPRAVAFDGARIWVT